MQNFSERDFVPEEAKLIIDEVFQNLGLLTLEEQVEPDYLASHIVIENESGFISSGSGKGKHHAIGARAEAIEHLLSQTELAELEQTASSHEIAKQKLLANDGICASLAKFDESKLSALHLETFDCTDERVCVPHILLNPEALSIENDDDLATSFIRKYSTNSGNAFGLSENEALLHATMESIERHTQSLLFQSMVKKADRPDEKFIVFEGKFIDLDLAKKFAIPTLPSLRIFAKQTVGGAYFFCVSESEPKNRLAEFGAGCSFSARYALERAVTELAQCIGLVRGKILDEDERAHLLFDKYRGLSALEGLVWKEQSSNFDNSLCLSDVLSDWADRCDLLNTEKMVDKIVGNLKEEGFVTLKKVTKFGQKGFVASVYIPGFDRFHLIRSGFEVAPNSSLL